MQEQDTDREQMVLVSADLYQVLVESINQAETFWTLAEPLLRRNATRNLMAGLSSNWYRVYDGLRHSVGLISDAALVSSDGTLVWPEDPETAVTNESRGSDGQSERPEMAASGSRSGSGTSGRDSAEVAAAHRYAEAHGMGSAVAASGSTSYLRVEGEVDVAHRKAAQQEARRLSKLRAESRSKAAKRYPRRRK